MKKLTFSILTIYYLSANAQPGTLDNSFGTGGIVTTEFSPADGGNDVAIQSDGKIIVVGEGGYGIELARYNSDGSLDLSFGSGGKVTTAIGNSGSGGDAIATQGDGKIVVGGYGGGDFALVRYNSNGSLDNTFGSGGIVTTDFGNSEGANSLVIQSDGKIVLGGNVLSNKGQDFALARYNSNGSLDNTYGTGGKVVTSVTNLSDH